MTIEEAQKKIAAILQQLESETDSVVRSLDLHDIEVTCICDARRKVERMVLIEMERLPGTNWSQ